MTTAIVAQTPIPLQAAPTWIELRDTWEAAHARLLTARSAYDLDWSNTTTRTAWLTARRDEDTAWQAYRLATVEGR